jgi:DNA-binding MarR family transcriptional regulator
MPLDLLCEFVYCGGVGDNNGSKEAQQQGDRWADLADLILTISREIQVRGYTDPAALSLTTSEAAVMRHLQQEPSTGMTDLINATGLLRTNLSTVLKSLDEKGLIERRVRAENRREITVHRTLRGRRNYEVVRREWSNLISRAAPLDEVGIDDAGIAQALELLSSIRDGLIAERTSKPFGADAKRAE